MLWTVMVAGEAGEARAVVLPLWLKAFASNQVLGGAYACAYSASYAFVAVYLEFLVGDEVLLEETAEQS